MNIDLKCASVTTMQTILHIVRTRLKRAMSLIVNQAACFLSIYLDVWRKHVYVKFFEFYELEAI